MSDCGALRESMPLLLTESLDPVRRELTHQHIESCDACSGVWAAYRETWRVMDDLPQVAVPARAKARFLEAAGIAHTWEPPEGEASEPPPPFGNQQVWEVWPNLVIGEEHEAAVDAFLDEVEFPDAIEGVDDEEASDEDVYAVMGDLYNAADRLMGDPADLAVAGDFFDAADAAREMAAPFGIDDALWGRIQGLAIAVTEKLEQEAEDVEVVELAAELRDLLFHYV